MKKLTFLTAILFALPMIGFGQNVNIPDANFKAYLVGNTAINTNGDTEIQVSEASIFNGNIDCNGMNISNLTGIEAFTAITSLVCYMNSLTILNVSANTALTYLSCDINQLTSLDASACTALTYLACSSNNLTSLNGCSALTYLSCSHNPLSSLNLSTCTALTDLYCTYTPLTSLDVSANTALTFLSCTNNQLTNLNVNNGNNINMNLFANFNPNLSCIEVDNVAWSNTNWQNIDAASSFSLYCSGAGISDINESNILMISPNPTSSEITITSEKFSNEAYTLCDQMGRVVGSGKLTGTNTTISLSSLSKGIYLLKVEGDYEAAMVVKE